MESPNPFFDRPGHQAKMDQEEAALVLVAKVVATYWKALIANGVGENAATALCIGLQDSWSQQRTR